MAGRNNRARPTRGAAQAAIQRSIGRTVTGTGATYMGKASYKSAPVPVPTPTVASMPARQRNHWVAPKKKGGRKSRAFSPGRVVPVFKSVGRGKRVGEKALAEIRFYQKSYEFVFPRAPFKRLVREITFDLGWQHQVTRWNLSAIDAVQEAAEAHLCKIFHIANLLAIHGKRVTIQQRDMQMLYQILMIWQGEQIGPGRVSQQTEESN